MKKETYFHLPKIEAQAIQMIQQVQASVGKNFDKVPQLAVSETALIILDMQRFFLDPSSHAFVPSALAIIPGINRLIDLWDGPLWLTQHSNDPSNTRMMNRWWQGMIDRQSPWFDLSDQMHTSKGRIIEKHQYDAFLDTDLESQLRSQQVKRVMIGGVMTHLCCETTARSAFMKGWEVIFLVNGCATYHRRLHMASLTTLAHGFAHLMRVEEVLGNLDQKRAH